MRKRLSKTAYKLGVKARAIGVKLEVKFEVKFEVKLEIALVLPTSLLNLLLSYSFEVMFLCTYSYIGTSAFTGIFL